MCAGTSSIRILYFKSLLILYTLAACMLAPHNIFYIPVSQYTFVHTVLIRKLYIEHLLQTNYFFCIWEMLQNGKLFIITGIGYCVIIFQQICIYDLN